MNIVSLILGGNIGNRMENILAAQNLISENMGKIISLSSIYESISWGYVDSKKYLNRVLIIETELNPLEILKSALLIEKKLGRVRYDKTRYSARTMDIDILFFNDKIINNDDLIIPHPQIQNRKFVLVPLVELMGNYVHPLLNRTIEDLLLECKDNGTICKV